MVPHLEEQLAMVVRQVYGYPLLVQVAEQVGFLMEEVFMAVKVFQLGLEAQVFVAAAVADVEELAVMAAAAVVVIITAAAAVAADILVVVVVPIQLMVAAVVLIMEEQVKSICPEFKPMMG